MKTENINKKIKKKILLNPGPCTTTNEVKKALVLGDICPREKEFGEVTESIMHSLLKIIKGKQEDYAAILFGGSGTLAMESIITSLPNGSEEILIISNGHYGERFLEIAKRYKKRNHFLAFSTNEKININKIEEKLKNKQIKYVYITHLETTTGILNNIKSINCLAHKYGKVTIVDAMCSFGAIPIDAKKDQIDFLIASSNKCLQGMPGISFVIAKKQHLETLKNKTGSSYYADLYDQYDHFLRYNQFRFTPPVQILYALKEALRQLEQEGGPTKRYKRYQENYFLLKKGLSSLGFDFFIPGIESKILISIMYPKDSHFDFDVLHDKLYAKGFTIYPGKSLGLNTFRLSVLGDLNQKDIEKFLKDLKKTISEMNISLPLI